MSPEQVAGERDLDARSDVYSLACVTYEMLAGDPPFVASTAQAVMAKHVKDPAPPIATTRPSVGRMIANALAKALNKTPVDRYESAGAFMRALTAAQPADDDVKSIVVLPFGNLSPDPDNEYFTDGLNEELTTDLSKLKRLRVISRNSAMQLKGHDKDTRTIGRELDVQFVLQDLLIRAAIQTDRDQMDALATEAVVPTWRRDPQWSWLVAAAYALADHREKALDWMANAVDRGFTDYNMLARLDPFLTRLRGDPRFEETVARAKREWEQFAG